MVPFLVLFWCQHVYCLKHDYQEKNGSTFQNGDRFPKEFLGGDILAFSDRPYIFLSARIPVTTEEATTEIVTTQATVNCPSPFTQLSTGCYLVDGSSASWDEAESACTSHDSAAHLAQIDSTAVC